MKTKKHRSEAELRAELQSANFEPALAAAIERHIKPIVGITPDIQSAVRNAVIDTMVAFNKAMQDSSLRIYSPQS